MSGVRTPGLRVSRGTYQFFLLLFPRRFRDTYGQEMRRLFGEMYEDCYRRKGLLAAMGVSAYAMSQALFSAISERKEEAVEEDHEPRLRSRRRGSPLGRPRDHLRTAVRSIRRSPGFSGLAVLLLGLGIGSATTIFSVVDGVVLKPLPYPKADDFVYVSRGSHSPPLVQDFQEQLQSLQDVVAARRRDWHLLGDGSPTRVPVGWVTEGFLEAFGAQPAHGRFFRAQDHRGAPRVAVLSYEFWQSRWGEDPAVVGRTITLEGQSLEIVGVVNQGFQAPEALLGRTIDIWTPFDLRMPEYQSRGRFMLQVAARLTPGVSLERADAEMTTLSERLAEAYPEDHTDQEGNPERYPLTTLHQATVGDMDGTVVLLLGAVGFLLAIACVNVAGLMLARGARRDRETALRLALGARRRVVVVEVLSESLLVSLIGGAAGVGLAYLGVELFTVLDPGGLPRTQTVGVDGRVLAFTLAVSLATGLVFGVLPALQALRIDPGLIIGSARGPTRSKASARLQDVLVSGELALALALLTGAGLLFHSFLRIVQVDPGFEVAGLVSVQLELTPDYDPQARILFTNDLRERLEALPGVERTGAGFSLPFHFTGGWRCCWTRGLRPPEAPNQEVEVFLHPITEGYFETLGVSLTAGRTFDASEAESSPVPAILNRASARELFGDADPVGRQFSLNTSGSERGRVVGVVSDVLHWGLQDRPEVEIYVPYARYGGIDRVVAVAVRAGVEPNQLVAATRNTVWSIDPNLPITAITPLTSLVDGSLSQERFYASLLGVFAALAGLLAVAGVYGTFVYSVRQRQRETGIRLAIGASSGQIVRDVLRRGGVVIVAGLLAGTVVSLWWTRFLEAMVFEISTVDISTFSAAALLLAFVALLACYLPALKAGRTDPLEALRTE